MWGSELAEVGAKWECGHPSTVCLEQRYRLPFGPAQVGLAMWLGQRADPLPSLGLPTLPNPILPRASASCWSHRQSEQNIHRDGHVQTVWEASPSWGFGKQDSFPEERASQLGPR